MKALIALYEHEVRFTPKLVDLSDPAQRAELAQIWPMIKFPVLRDEASDRTIPEATIIIEYLEQYHPGPAPLIPRDPALAWQTRLRDRFYDLHVQSPMQKIVGDRLRPADRHDPHGVEEAISSLRGACAFVDGEMATRTWANGDAFSMADCAAAPALFYADKVLPFGDQNFNNARAYLGRLMERPSFARVLAEAQPYFAMFPA
jgi:glutathione S-transferase